MRKKYCVMFLVVVLFSIIGLHINYAIWSDKMKVSNHVSSGGLEFCFDVDSVEKDDLTQLKLENSGSYFASLSGNQKQLILRGIDLTPILFQTDSEISIPYKIKNLSEMQAVSNETLLKRIQIKNDLGYIACSKLSEQYQFYVDGMEYPLSQTDFLFPETISTIHAYNQVSCVDEEGILYGTIILKNELALVPPVISNDWILKETSGGEVVDEEEDKTDDVEKEEEDKLEDAENVENENLDDVEVEEEKKRDSEVKEEKEEEDKPEDETGEDQKENDCLKEELEEEEDDKEKKLVVGRFRGEAEYSFSIPLIFEQPVKGEYK